MKKVNFINTVNSLKSQNLISETDITLYCIDAPNLTIYGSLLGGAMMLTHLKKAPRHILALNDNEIKVFDIDKITGEYLNVRAIITKPEMSKIKISGLMDKRLHIKTSNQQLCFMLFKREYAFIQRKEYKCFLAAFKKYYRK
jgi:hypothetical protein